MSEHACAGSTGTECSPPVQQMFPKASRCHDGHFADEVVLKIEQRNLGGQNRVFVVTSTTISSSHLSVQLSRLPLKRFHEPTHKRLHLNLIQRNCFHLVRFLSHWRQMIPFHVAAMVVVQHLTTTLTRPLLKSVIPGILCLE